MGKSHNYEIKKVCKISCNKLSSGFNRKWLCENVPEFEETCHSVSSHRIDKP